MLVITTDLSHNYVELINVYYNPRLLQILVLTGGNPCLFKKSSETRIKRPYAIHIFRYGAPARTPPTACKKDTMECVNVDMMSYE